MSATTTAAATKQSEIATRNVANDDDNHPLTPRQVKSSTIAVLDGANMFSYIWSSYHFMLLPEHIYQIVIKLQAHKHMRWTRSGTKDNQQFLPIINHKTNFTQVHVAFKHHLMFLNERERRRRRKMFQTNGLLNWGSFSTWQIVGSTLDVTLWMVYIANKYH